jgi:hypothetical protein
MTIRGSNIFVVKIRGKTIFSWQSGDTFEHGLPQQSESSYQPFYIDCPPVRGEVLMNDFTSLKYIRGGLFRPKLTTNGRSWHTIS